VREKLVRKHPNAQKNNGVRAFCLCLAATFANKELKEKWAIGYRFCNGGIDYKAFIHKRL
jgi:hypothetical protein